MTGTVVFRQALSLLNYTDTHGDGGVPGGAALYKRALAVLNQIVADLWYIGSDEPFVPLATLGDEIPLPLPTVLNVLPYGVAMLLAQIEGDADNQTLFAAQYDQRRSSTAREGGRMLDRLPTCRG